MKRRDMLKAGLVAGAALSTSGRLLAKAYNWEDPFPVKGKVTVAEFGAKWCAGCPEMEVIFNKVKDYYGDRVAMVYVDMDKYQGIEEKYLIDRMPSQRFFDVHGSRSGTTTGRSRRRSSKSVSRFCSSTPKRTVRRASSDKRNTGRFCYSA